jgi:hypothetical protein
MMTKRQQEIRIYNNLLDDKSGLYNWKDTDSYSFDELTPQDISVMNDISAIEVSFQGVADERDQFDSLFENINLFIRKFVLSSDIQSYCFKSEFKIGVKNKIRSYKGIVSKEINSSDYLQVELPITDSYTIIASLIKFKSTTADYLTESFFDNANCFIITSKREDFFSEEFLFSVVKNVMKHKGTSVVNYSKLIASYCWVGDIIYCSGGDGGDKEVDFQIFCHKVKKDLMLIQVDNAL